MNRLLLSIISAILVWSCSSDPKPEVLGEDAVNDALVSFTYNSQSGRYSEALEQITYEDQLKIIDNNGDWKPEYKAAAKRIKISALQKMHFSVDSQGRLEGMIAVLDEANSKFTMSDEQRSINLDKVEKNRKSQPVADSTKPAPVAPVKAPEAVVDELDAAPDADDMEESTEKQPAKEPVKEPTKEPIKAPSKEPSKTDAAPADTSSKVKSKGSSAEDLDVDELFK